MSGARRPGPSLGSLRVCGSAGPRTWPPPDPSLPHYREDGHKSRKSSLIVLSWLAKDRQQAINNTREGGRNVKMLSYSSLNLLKKIVRIAKWFRFLHSCSSKLFRWVQGASDIIYDRGFMINCGKIHGSLGFINILGRDLHFSTRPTNIGDH